MFRTDDGFGSEVAGGWPPVRPDGVRVVDYGIRGLHLAYDLLDPWDVLVLVDALPDRGAVGSVAVLEIGPDDVGAGGGGRRARHGPGHRAGLPGRARRRAARRAPSSSAARSPRPGTAWG